QLNEQATQTLDSLADQFPAHPLIDESLFLQANMAWEKQEWQKCEKLLQTIIDLHFTEIKYDDAIWKLGQLYEKQLDDSVKAMALYEKILTEQPGSLYVTEARKSYRRLRGDNQPQ
ncbi:MAG: tetratricopeptide repeat protein, partial [Bacteroidetes bacterium]|nr:tetratricopeptide repeat protein [Bacteroidota bacterium]